jgi:hypothetical protein
MAPHLQVFHDGHAHEDAAAFRRLRDLQSSDLVGRQLRNVAAGKRDVLAGRGLPKIVIISVDYRRRLLQSAPRSRLRRLRRRRP